MPLFMDAGTGPGDIVLDGKPAPGRKVHDSPHFWPMSVVAKQSLI